MQAFTCMLCKKNDREFINICYKNGRNSAKDDILELCGNSVEQYLESDDLVCCKCIKVLDSAAQLKRQIYEIIIEHGSNRKAPNNRKSNLHINNVSRSDYEESPDDDSSSNASATPPRFVELSGSPQNFLSRSPRNYIITSSPRTRASPHNVLTTSPNNLLIIKHSIPFDQRSDTDMEEANSKYRYNDRNTPSLDREVQRANFRGRRKTRGHNWTRRKGSQNARSRSRSLARSSYSRQSRVSRTTSRLSRGTTASRKQHVQKQSETLQKTRILSDFLYQNDALSQFTRAYLSKSGEVRDEDTSFEYEWNENVTKPVVKTRYASELRDRLLSEYEEYIYECPVNSCQEILLSLEQITEHRVKEHNEMALFWCEQCKFSYLSQEHLDKHNNQHYQKFLSYCIYCSEEFTNKKLYEEHLNEHLIHSFPCIYCDKFFLRKQLCENHIREQHPGRKKKIKRIKPQSILDRIDKYPDQREEPNNLYTKNKPEEFIVKILCQPGQQEDINSTNDEDLLDSNCEDAVNESYLDNDTQVTDTDVSLSDNR